MVIPRKRHTNAICGRALPACGLCLLRAPYRRSPGRAGTRMRGCGRALRGSGRETELMYDVIVAGLGGMGSPTAHELAARGKRVLGLDRHAPGHDRGSSHGGSRLIRQAYFEDPAYVPLVLRAYELWEELERETGRDLMNLCGGLMLGRRGSEVLEGSLRSAREHDLSCEVLEAGEGRRRFPALAPTEGTLALYEAAAGFINPPAARTRPPDPPA